MSAKTINASKLVKLLTGQPFFVWKDLTELTAPIEDENKLAFNFPNFIDEPWAIDEFNLSYSQTQILAFKKIESQYLRWLRKKFGAIYELKSQTLLDRAAETQKLLQQNQIQYLFNPTFMFISEDYQVLATPALYDLRHKIVYFNKYSASTKRLDLIKMYFDVKLMELLGLEVKEVYLHLFATKDYAQGEIDFFETKYINTVKSGRQNSEARHNFDFLSLQLLKAGLGTKHNGDPLEAKSIMEIIDEQKLIIKAASKKKSANIFYFDDFKSYLKKIIAAEKIDQVYYPQPLDDDTFQTNPAWVNLLELKAPEYAGFNHNIVSKKAIIEVTNLSDLAETSPVIEQFLSAQKPIINDKQYVASLLKKLTQDVIWYDFEAFSLPVAPLASVLPYNQVVSQVSVIETQNMQELYHENLVLDPLNYQVDHFWLLLKAVYKPNAYYVVYNQNYENARWREMSELLFRAKDPKAEDFAHKVQEIIDHTLDLADVFKVKSAKTLPIIFIPELKFKHSIKLLEKYINAHFTSLNYKIKPYANLDIKHGLMAMEVANNRALGLIGDQEWKQKVKQLKEYCANDVKAMIMVYHLIKSIFASR